MFMQCKTNDIDCKKKLTIKNVHYILKLFMGFKKYVCDILQKCLYIIKHCTCTLKKYFNLCLKSLKTIQNCSKHVLEKNLIMYFKNIKPIMFWMYMKKIRRQKIYLKK